jgi:trehalose-6-phosphate synthase
MDFLERSVAADFLEAESPRCCSILPGAAWASLCAFQELTKRRSFMELVERLAPARAVTKAENATGQGIDAGERYSGKQEEIHVNHLPINELRDPTPSLF